MLRSVQVTPRFRGVTEADLKSFRSNWSNFLPADVSSTKAKTSKKSPKKTKRS